MLDRNSSAVVYSFAALAPRQSNAPTMIESHNNIPFCQIGWWEIRAVRFDTLWDRVSGRSASAPPGAASGRSRPQKRGLPRLEDIRDWHDHTKFIEVNMIDAVQPPGWSRRTAGKGVLCSAPLIRNGGEPAPELQSI